MPTVLGTLDAIHLATALAVKDALSIALRLLTHDKQLAVGASAVGLEVDGV
jgi:predicted nucleic acid-binding protein